MHYPSQLIDALKNYSSTENKKIILKPHPSWPPPPGLESFQIMEKKFPVELLKGIPKTVIGIASTAMFGFSQHKVISLIHLVKFEKEESKNYLLKYIEGKNIICPKTISELEEEFKKLF